MTDFTPPYIYSGLYDEEAKRYADTARVAIARLECFGAATGTPTAIVHAMQLHPVYVQAQNHPRPFWRNFLYAAAMTGAAMFPRR